MLRVRVWLFGAGGGGGTTEFGSVGGVVSGWNVGLILDDGR